MNNESPQKEKTYGSSIISLYFGIASIFLLLPASCFAMFGNVDPINVNVYGQVQVTPSLSSESTQKRNDLIAKYGVLLVDSCSANEQRCTSNMDQYQYASCVSAVELDLAYGTQKGCQAPCPSGDYRSKGQCVTPNEFCVANRGPNTEMASYDSATNIVSCQCILGYVWNSSRTTCVAEQIQQTPPTSGLQCNGKSWNACPWGETFSCPFTGDPTCLINQPANGSNKSLGNGSGGGSGSGGSGIATKPPVKQPSAPVSHSTKASQVVHEATSTASTIGTTTVTGADNKATTTPTYHKGLVQNVWSWVIGLFGF